MEHFPIDTLIPRILETIQSQPSVVVQAPPGAGKTTRIPLALLQTPSLKGKKIIMLQPRRMAAVNAARWIAACLGEQVGETVGYAIRFERKASASTRLEVVTEGILTRRLQRDPTMPGVGMLIFDEFHERSLNADLSLAMALDARDGLRDDLKIIVMSATLDGEPVARLLGDAPVLTTEGRGYPVEVRYGTAVGERDIATSAAAAVRAALRETEGDILVFLPGSGEIRSCQRLLADLASEGAILVSPLYGDLPFREQEKAILPADKRKVVLATNIAETSLTIQGVRVVIDSGWERRVLNDPGSGLDRMMTVRISAASAEQRKGRAGRVAPGVCYRLWSEHQQTSLVPFSPPEIMTADLAPLALELAGWGVREPASLRWLDPPPAASLASGRRLLQVLGAIDDSHALTPLGRQMIPLPLHPRLASMVIQAKGEGCGATACDISAILSVRDLFTAGASPGRTRSTESDMVDRLEALERWRSRRETFDGADHVLLSAAARISSQLRRELGVGSCAGTSPPEMVGLLLARAYPDRIARRRETAADRYVMTNGRGMVLSPGCGVRGKEFLLAFSVGGEGQAEGIIHLASALGLAAIRNEFSSSIRRRRAVYLDPAKGRVAAREEELLFDLLLSHGAALPTPEEKVTTLLDAIRSSGMAALRWSKQAGDFRARAAFVREHDATEDWPDLSDRCLSESLSQWLAPWIQDAGSLADVAAVDLLEPLKALFSYQQLRRLEMMAPTHITVPSGSRLAVRYGDEPVLEVKLQEMFGLGETPVVAGGKVPVLLHLLSPAGRPVQVTRDLRGFWEGAYNEVRKELKGRYPKHPWPENPWNAVPTRHVKKRLPGGGGEG